MFRFGLMAALLFGVIDPATQIKAAKEAIAAHDFDRAVILLREGLAGATDRDALAALHFYSALALSGKGADDKARSELREFARLKPGASSVDPNKFPPRFVKLFNEVVAQRPAI